MKNQFPYICIFTVVLCLLPILSIAQTLEQFVKNPSFEDAPRKGSYYNSILEAQKNNIKDWFDCGIIEFPENTAPDIHAEKTGYWSVKHSPSEGFTFLGLTIREEGSWESVSQELLRPLSKDSCYNFTIDLSKSLSYQSGIRNKEKELFPFDKSITLIIWGGYSKCNKSEILYKSPPIDNEEWQSYGVNLHPKSDIKHLTIQASFIDDRDPYNGNILIDNISEFTVTACEEE